MNEHQEKKSCSKTRKALFISSILNEPLLTLSSLLAVILVKELGASAWEIGLLTMVKPIMALFSLYFSSFVFNRPERLIKHVIWTSLLARLPFLLFPWVQAPWQAILIMALYMMLYRGGMPSWIEVLKLNLNKGDRSRDFSLSSVLGYIEGLALAIVLGSLLTQTDGVWRYLFPLSALCGMVSLFWMSKIPIRLKQGLIRKDSETKKSLKDNLIDPWCKSLNIMRERRDFRAFQWGFTWCGAGVMMTYAVMYHYFVNDLGVSYRELALAFAFYKGAGYALSSQKWARHLDSEKIFASSRDIFLVISLFPLLLFVAAWQVEVLYLAFFVYGLGLAGNHLIWNLSGPIFSSKEDSSSYSTVNILMVGVRGIIFPGLGAVLMNYIGAGGVLILSFSVCLIGSLTMQWAKTRLSNINLVQF